MGYKIRDRGFHGDERLHTIAEYVEVQLGQVGGPWYGQAEQMEAELKFTQKMLFRLVGIVSRSMTPSDIYELTGANWEDPGMFDAQIVEDSGS